MTEEGEKLPLPQSLQGQVALLEILQVWLVGKHFVKCKDVQTRSSFFLVKNVKNVFFFVACRNEKESEKELQIMITKHGVYYNNFCVDRSAVLLCGHRFFLFFFFTKNQKQWYNLHSLAVYSLWLDWGLTVHFDKQTIVVESRQEETRES